MELINDMETMAKIAEESLLICRIQIFLGAELQNEMVHDALFNSASRMSYRAV